MLTERQIAKYRHDGYLFPLPALSASELAESNDGLARFGAERWRHSVWCSEKLPAGSSIIAAPLGSSGSTIA